MNEASVFAPIFISLLNFAHLSRRCNVHVHPCNLNSKFFFLSQFEMKPILNFKMQIFDEQAQRKETSR